ncbi:hypothetical protein EUGRSUZ_E00954 [Eucalyptus grandis]|uniref:Uncharacterized protein n=2 Tax=Eucalyptus grandis TaxID=71139 RepID=A0ACC3KPM4_EUCGR|nr:hypothetical protein EUGRSUZ_E00954 [Eucalyptus grandis]
MPSIQRLFGEAWNSLHLLSRALRPAPLPLPALGRTSQSSMSKSRVPLLSTASETTDSPRIEVHEDDRENETSRMGKIAEWMKFLIMNTSCQLRNDYTQTAGKM